MDPRPPHSLHLHDAHSEYPLPNRYLLQADLRQHFANAHLTFLTPLKPRPSSHESLWHNWWASGHGRCRLKMPVYLHLETDHPHLPASGVLQNVRSEFVSLDAGEPVGALAPPLPLFPGVGHLEGNTVQLCKMAFGISLLPFHLKHLAASDTDSICNLNNSAVFSLPHAFSVGSSLNIQGLILLI